MNPTFTVTHTIDSVDLSDDVKRVELFLRENAVSNAILTLNDTYSKTYENAVSQYDTLRIDLKGVGSTEAERFGGYATHLIPSRDLKETVCGINCVGFGVALNRMRVAQEYGTQSNNPTLDTILEIITDASYGVVPKYVNKIFATAVSSQYDIQTANGADVYIYDETTSLRYVKCPYTPAMKVVNQLCDLISADNYTDEGTHWQVIPSAGVPYLCIDVVNNHHAPITDLWPNDSPSPTLIEGINIHSQNLTKYPATANYIVYFGKFQKPTAERATEGASPHSQWTATLGAVSTSATSIVGSASVLCSTGVGVNMYWPSVDMAMDVTAFGTERTIPTINFYLMRNASANASPIIEIEVGSIGSGNYYYHTCYLPNAAEWYHFSFPIGPYYNKLDFTNGVGTTENFKWLTVGAGHTWTDISNIRIVDIGGADSQISIDDFHFDGIVTRGAKSTNAITAQRTKMDLVTDSLATDDSILASDDSGTVAQLAKAHLLRAKVTPISGKITIDLNENILPGQIQAIQCNKQRDGTYKIDDDFRILEVHHTITRNGGTTELTVTDDIINGIARDPTNSYNNMQRAVSPDFQTTTNADLKARDIDILQAILETNYA